MRIPRTCLLVLLALNLSSVHAQESCFNAIDDDADGLIDLNDTTDCACLQGLTIGGPSLITNPSFEAYDCLPTNWSMLECATGWEQASVPTGDYFNTASYYPAIFPQPVPDGNGLVGGYMFPDWREYIGTCLEGPMLAGEHYVLTLDIASVAVDGVFSAVVPIYFGQVEVTLFGRADCVPFPLSTLDCPEPLGWTALGSATYTPGSLWSTLSISFVPAFDVATIMLGAPCDLPPDYVTDPNGFNPYFLYDDLRLNLGAPYLATIDQGLDAVIDTSDGSCEMVHALYAHPDTLTGIYQWYHEGVALLGQTDTILDLVGNGLAPGLYQFYCYVDDTTCAVTAISAQLPAYLAPSFTISDSTGCAPFQVLFANTTPSGPPITCLWTLEGIGVTSVCNPLITYPDPGSYTVTFTISYPNACPMDTTVIDVVQVFANSTAEISAEGDLLCAYPIGNSTQWYLNGEPIGTTDCIMPTGPGAYTAFVDYGLPCQAISEPYLIIGIADAERSSAWELSCIGDRLTVRAPNPLRNGGTWSILDATGRTLTDGGLPSHGTLQVDLSDHATGVYFFRVRQYAGIADTVIRFALVR